MHSLDHNYEFDTYLGVYPVTGPLGRSVDDLIMLQKLLLSSYIFANDIRCPPIKFNDELVNVQKKLRIGYIKDVGTFYP
jgi:hypothetical protein